MPARSMPARSMPASSRRLTSAAASSANPCRAGFGSSPVTRRAKPGSEPHDGPGPPGSGAFLPVGYPRGKHRTTPATRTVNRDMSYDPSHYQPPAQGRWPNATPAEAWPSYRDDDVYRDGERLRSEERLDGQYGADRQGAYQATAGYQRQIGYQRASGESGDHGYPSALGPDRPAAARNGYADAGGYSAADGHGGNGPVGYASAGY